MSEIVIRRIHGMSVTDARDAAERVADDLGEEFDLDYAWDGDTLRFNRAGVHGELHVTEEEVEIRVRLGFLLGIWRPRIEQEIHRYFDENFGEEPGESAV